MTSFGPASASPSAEPASADRFEQSYSTGDRCRLVLENARGRIQVTGWDRPEVRVHATKRIGTSSPERFAATRIDLQHQGDTVVIRTLVDRSLLVPAREAVHETPAQFVRALTDLIHGGHNTPAEVVFDVRVPRQADLDVKGVSSDLVVEDVRGTLHLTTVSGELIGRSLAGSLRMKSVSGDVRIAGQIDELKASSVSGDIELTGALSPTGTYEGHTVSGDLTLRVRPDSPATVSASGVSVNVVCDLPHEVSQNVRRPGSRAWKVLVNGGGGAEVTFHSVSGTLRLTPWSSSAAEATHLTHPTTHPPAESAIHAPLHSAHEAAPRSEPAGCPATEPSADDIADESEVMTVLRALERGELSVDDALRQIDAFKH